MSYGERYGQRYTGGAILDPRQLLYFSGGLIYVGSHREDGTIPFHVDDGKTTRELTVTKVEYYRGSGWGLHVEGGYLSTPNPYTRDARGLWTVYAPGVDTITDESQITEYPVVKLDPKHVRELDGRVVLDREGIAQELEDLSRLLERYDGFGF